MSQFDGPSPVVPFYSLRLGDLVHAKAVLAISCGACLREGHLDILPLLASRGPGMGVKELERVVTCTQCRRKGFALVRVEWL